MWDGRLAANRPKRRDYRQSEIIGPTIPLSVPKNALVTAIARFARGADECVRPYTTPYAAA
jgi:hypothetical protein